MSIDLDRWAMFVAISDVGSLSRAAIATDKPQSLLSRQLTAMEETCGCALFHRTGRGLVPTEIGDAILPRVRALLAEADDILLSTRARSGVPTGRVSIGLLPSIDIASALVTAVAERFPEVTLHLMQGSTGRLAEAVASGRADLALLMRDPSGLVAHEEVVRRLSIHLVGPPGDALTAGATVPLSALNGLPLIMAASPNAFRLHIERVAARHGVKPNFPSDVDPLQMQMALVAAGHGWTVTTDLGARQNPPVQHARIVDPEIELPLVLAVSSQRPVTLAMRRVSELLRQLVPGKEIPTADI